MKLIDKDALVAEIEKRLDEYSSNILRHYDACTEARASELNKILTILNTLEVKDVDLEKESISWEDIPQLISIAERLRTDVYISTKRITREEFYKEVLKRFKNMKGK